VREFKPTFEEIFADIVGRDGVDLPADVPAAPAANPTEPTEQGPAEAPAK
jgi:hypothetical protein